MLEVAGISSLVLTLIGVSLCLPVIPLCAQTRITDRDDFDIKLSLYRPLDGAELQIDSLRFRFDMVRLPSPLPSVTGLLSAAKIHPDVEAVALLFDLNPRVAIHGSLYGEERIRFIRIEPAPELTKALSDGFLYKIHYDAELIRSLLQSGNTIEKAADAALGGAAPSEARDCFSSASDDLLQVLGHVKERDQPLNHVMLSQVRGDADLLLKTVEWITTPGTAVTRTDTRTICSVARDLQLKRERFRDTRSGTPATMEPWPMVRVIVSTIDAKTGKPVRLLTVHCVPVALEGSAYHGQEFAGLSSPSEQVLPEADYVFWATKGQALTVLGRRVIPIRNSGGPVPIDLGIRQ